MLKLDLYDKKLLYQLDVDSRQSYVQLAKRVGLSKDAVKYRINNYITNGLIDGFYTLIDSSKLGYTLFRVYLKFRNTTLEIEEDIIAYFSKDKNILWLGRTEGMCDLLIGYWAKSITEFKFFWSKFRNIYSKNIYDEKHSIFIEFNNFQRNYLVNEKIQKISTMKESKNLSQNIIDDIDKKILEELTKNARISIIDLTSKTKLTSKAIIVRIRSLERKGIILGYRTKINLEKIGYSMYKTDIVLRTHVKIREIQGTLFNLPNIISSEKTFGGPDFEFDLEVQNFEEYNKIINLLKNKFGQEIESLTYYRTLKLYKTLFLPAEL